VFRQNCIRSGCHSFYFEEPIFAVLQQVKQSFSARSRRRAVISRAIFDPLNIAGKFPEMFWNICYHRIDMSQAKKQCNLDNMMEELVDEADNTFAESN